MKGVLRMSHQTQIIENAPKPVAGEVLSRPARVVRLASEARVVKLAKGTLVAKKAREARMVFREHPMLSPTLSMGWNLLYAMVNAALAFYYVSWWFVTLCAYYAVLGLMRLSAVTVGRSRRRQVVSTMRHIGWAMLLPAIAVAGLTAIAIREQRNPVHDKSVMIFIALVTFFWVGIVIRNIVRAHRSRSAVMVVVRNISCAGAIGSLLSLERAMLGTFGDASGSFAKEMQSVSGTIAFFLLALLGVGLVCYARRFQERGEG